MVAHIMYPMILFLTNLEQVLGSIGTVANSYRGEDIEHDRQFFHFDDTFKSSLKYGSKYLPRHLYDFSQLHHPLNVSKSSTSSSKVITSPNQVLPPGFQNQVLQPFYDPSTIAAALVEIKQCLTQTNGFTDPDIGTFELDPQTYCQPQTNRFIPGVTCCAPTKPDEIPIRLLFFPDARGSPGQPMANYGLQGSGRANNYGPQQTPVTELNWRSKRRPKLIPQYGKVVYLIHGFADNVSDSVWVRPVAREWNARGASVIAVDWKFAKGNTFQSAADMRTLGAVVAQSIIQWNLVKRTLLVGHSMGAEAIGEAGRYAKRKGFLLRECTGLDPDGPNFDGGPPETRITKDDCRLVTIIHSAAEYTQFSTGILANRLGTVYKSGHCDYWINCGHEQGIRCTDPKYGDFIKRVAVASIKQYQLCAQNRATLVYLSQLRRECSFNGNFCTNCGTESNSINFNPSGCNIDSSRRTSRLPPFHDCASGMNVNYNVVTADRYPFC